MKLLINGSRGFDDYKLMELVVNKIMKHIDITEIVSGGARGADSLAEMYAKNNKVLFRLFEADWNKYGKPAGFIRNTQMLEYIEPNGLLVSFWDGKSRGTKDTIEKAFHRKLAVIIVDYIKNEVET